MEGRAPPLGWQQQAHHVCEQPDARNRILLGNAICGIIPYNGRLPLDQARVASGTSVIQGMGEGTMSLPYQHSYKTAH